MSFQEIQETIDHTRATSPLGGAQPSGGSLAPLSCIRCTSSKGITVAAAVRDTPSPPGPAGVPYYDPMSSPRGRPQPSTSNPGSPELGRPSRASGASHDSGIHTRPLPNLPQAGSPGSVSIPSRSTSYGADPQRAVHRNQTTGARYAGESRVPVGRDASPRPPAVTAVSAPAAPTQQLHAQAPLDEVQYATYASGPTPNGMRSPGRSQSVLTAEAPQGPRRALSDVGASAGRRPNLQPSDSLMARAALNVRANDPALEYLQPWLLSHIATFFRDRVRKTVNVKGSIEYPFSFTGREAVVRLSLKIANASELISVPEQTTVQSTFPPRLSGDRKLALKIARTLLREMFFHEVDWAETVLQDGVDDVYVFTEDEQHWGAGEAPPAGTSHQGLMAAGSSQPGVTPVPNGVLTTLTTCYSPYCTRETKDGRAVGGCYSRFCPNAPRPSVRVMVAHLSEAI